MQGSAGRDVELGMYRATAMALACLLSTAASPCRVAVLMRGRHESLTHDGGKGDASWRSSLAAQRELVFEPLARLCAVDVFIATEASPRYDAMAAAYRAVAAASGGQLFETIVPDGLEDPQRLKVILGLHAVAGAGHDYAAVVAWRFDVMPRRNVSTWPVRRGAVTVPFRESPLRPLPTTRRRPRSERDQKFCETYRVADRFGGRTRLSDTAFVLDGSMLRRAIASLERHAMFKGHLHFLFQDLLAAGQLAFAEPGFWDSQVLCGNLTLHGLGQL